MEDRLAKLQQQEETCGVQYDSDPELPTPPPAPGPSLFRENAAVQDSKKWSHLCKKQKNKREKRLKAREAAAQAENRMVKQISLTRRSQSKPHAIQTDLKAKKLHVATSGWIGTLGSREQATPSFAELIDGGMKYVSWDGK